MSSKHTNYLSSAVKFIENSGLFPSSKFYQRFISICFSVPMTFLFVYLIVLKLFSNEEKDVLFFAEAFESLTNCAHLLVRKYVMFFYGLKIKKMLKDRTENFWAYDIKSSESGGRYEKMMIICDRITKFIVSCGLLTTGIYCLTTVVDNTKKVPLFSWIPEDDNLVTGLIYAMEIFVLLEIIYCLLALDCFYVLVCTDLRIQFILLREAVQSVKVKVGKEEKALGKLIKCTKQHTFLLNFHRDLNTTFSVYFVILYLITVACASMHSYIVLFKAPSLTVFIKSSCYLFGMLFQTGLYFIITSNIEIEAENLTEKIYNVNWEVTDDIKVRKHILFMLMRSQKPVSITGGGMFHVNRNEYVGMLRLTYSIATILGGMT